MKQVTIGYSLRQKTNLRIDSNVQKRLCGKGSKESLLYDRKSIGRQDQMFTSRFTRCSRISTLLMSTTRRPLSRPNNHGLSCIMDRFLPDIREVAAIRFRWDLSPSPFTSSLPRGYAGGPEPNRARNEPHEARFLLAVFIVPRGPP